MLKLFLVSILFLLGATASTINFEEEKYIEVLDDTIIKKGTLEFTDTQIKLQYKNSNRILIYGEDTLIIKINDEIQELDLNNQLALKTVFLLIEAIHKNDLELLKEFFIINKKQNIYTLNPKEILQNYIEMVEFKKNKTLDYITIHMTNGNKTTIREVND